MNRLQARFVVDYRFVPESEFKCKAIVKLYLPTESNSVDLVRVLRDPNTKIFGSILGPVWGVHDNGYRYNSYTLKAKTWDELESKIYELMDETVSKLRTVRAMNEVMEEKKPRDKEVMFPI